MKTSTFIQGMSVGVLAGAALTAVVLPLDRKQLKKSAPGRALKSMTRMMEHLS